MKNLSFEDITLLITVFGFMVTLAGYVAIMQIDLYIKKQEKLRKARLDARRKEFEVKRHYRNKRFQEFKEYIESQPEVPEEDSFKVFQVDGKLFADRRSYCKENCIECYINNPNQYMTCYFKDFNNMTEFEFKVQLNEDLAKFDAGVDKLISNSPFKYRPYDNKSVNRLDNIRDTLREFTVGEVLSAFY